jgi:hypothetical protein
MSEGDPFTYGFYFALGIAAAIIALWIAAC